jgi:hypothetical protein
MKNFGSGGFYAVRAEVIYRESAVIDAKHLSKDSLIVLNVEQISQDTYGMYLEILYCSALL